MQHSVKHQPEAFWAEVGSSVLGLFGWENLFLLCACEARRKSSSWGVAISYLYFFDKRYHVLMAFKALYYQSNDQTGSGVKTYCTFGSLDSWKAFWLWSEPSLRPDLLFGSFYLLWLTHESANNESPAQSWQCICGHPELKLETQVRKGVQKIVFFLVSPRAEFEYSC